MAKSTPVNNTPLNEHDTTSGMTIKEVQTIQRDYMLKLNQNTLKLSAEVVGKLESEPRAIIDKQTNMEIIDSDTGEIKTYPINYSVKLAFNGGEKEIPVNKVWYDALHMDGSRYLFEGRLGSVRVYGKDIVDVVFNNYQLI